MPQIETTRPAKKRNQFLKRRAIHGREWAAEQERERRARQRRLAQRLKDDADVERYRLERELAMLRWTIHALTPDAEAIE